MMRKVAGLIGVLAVVGCTSTSSPDAVVTRGPSLTFVNGPETPGPLVYRTANDPFFIILNDDRSIQLASLMRASDPTNLEPCGGTNSLDPADLQLVFHPSGSVNQTLIARGVAVVLYDRRPFLNLVRDEGLCSAMNQSAPLYVGTASFVAHDNDTFFSGNHPDAFGFSAIGVVTRLSDGKRFRYQNEYHGVLGTDGNPLQFHQSIRLTPLK